MKHVIEVTDASFSQQVLASDVPVVVDFWAPWCPPCRVINPILEELAQEYAGKLTIAKLNVDEYQQQMVQLGVTGAPTLVVFKGGKEIDRIIGAMRKPQYQARFDSALAQ